MNSWYFFLLQMSFFASKSVSDLLFKGWTISTAGGKQCFPQNSLSPKKHILMLVQPFFWSLCGKKNPNYQWQKCCLPVKHFAASDRDAKYQLLKFLLAQRVKLFGEIVSGLSFVFTSTTPTLLLVFFPNFFLLQSISFYQASLSSVGKDVGKTFRFDYSMKCRWKAVEIIDGWGIQGIFRSTFHSFLDRPVPVLLGMV